MSIIAAGTTTTTALSSTGNTDGTLQLQVNGTTPSVTLNTLGAIGVGSTPNYGTSGQALVSAGSTAAPTWANVTTSPAGSNTQIQYNNSGSFGASSAFVFDGTNLGVLGGSVTTPAAKIHAVGSVRSSNSAGTTFTSLATDGIYSTGTDLYLLAPSGYSTIFYTNNTEKFRFGTAGQLGIGGANYGTSGQVLTSGGSGAAPTWSTPGGGSWIYLNSFSAGGVNYVDITGQFSSTYDDYVLIFEGVKASTTSEQLLAKIYYGGSLRSSGYWEVHTTVYNANTSNGSGGGASEVYLMPDVTGTNLSSQSIAGQIWFYNVNSASDNMCYWNTGYTQLTSGGNYGMFSSGYVRNSIGTALTGIRIYWSSTNTFGAGTFRLYGIKKS